MKHTQHSNKFGYYTGQSRPDFIESYLKRKLSCEKKCVYESFFIIQFFKEKGYLFANIIVKKTKSYSNGEFVKV